MVARALVLCVALGLALTVAAISTRGYDDGFELDALDLPSSDDVDAFAKDGLKPSKNARLASNTQIRVDIRTKYRRGRSKARKPKSPRRRRARARRVTSQRRFTGSALTVVRAFAHRLNGYFGKVPSTPRLELGNILQKYAKKHVHRTCKQDFRAKKCLKLLQKFFYGNGTSVSTKWHHKRAVFLVGSRRFRHHCCARSQCCMQEASTAAGDPYQTRKKFRQNLAHLLSLEIKRPKAVNPYAPKPKKPVPKKSAAAKKKFKEEVPYEVKTCPDLSVTTPHTCKKTTEATLRGFVRKVQRKTLKRLLDSEIDSKRLMAIVREVVKSKRAVVPRRRRRAAKKAHSKIVSKRVRKTSSVTVSANANGANAVGGTVNVNPGISAVNSQRTINIYQENRSKK